LIGAIRSLPGWLETALVVAAAFGVFVYSALAYEPAASVTYAASDFSYLAHYEIVVGAILLAFLFVRGWRMEALGFRRFQVRDLFDTALLTLSVFLVPTLLWSAFGDPDARSPMVVSEPGVSAAVAIAFSLINASYEEIFVCAYVVAAARKLGLAPAVLISAALRLSYHLYQGPMALITILPVGLIFAWYFAVRGRVWPLIVIHFALDLLALAPYMHGGER